MKQLSVWSYHLFADLHASKTLIILSNYDISINIYIYIMRYCAVVMKIGLQPKFRMFDLLHFVVGTSLEFLSGSRVDAAEVFLRSVLLDEGCQLPSREAGWRAGEGEMTWWIKIYQSLRFTSKRAGNKHDVNNHLRILALTLPHHHSNMLNVKNEYMAEWWSGFDILRNFINFLGQVSHKPIRKWCY